MWFQDDPGGGTGGAQDGGGAAGGTGFGQVVLCSAANMLVAGDRGGLAGFLASLASVASSLRQDESTYLMGYSGDQEIVGVETIRL